MPNPHFDITITQRSKGQSAVAENQKLHRQAWHPVHGNHAAIPRSAGVRQPGNPLELGGGCRETMERPAGQALRAGSAQRSSAGTVPADGPGLLREAVCFQGDDR